MNNLHIAFSGGRTSAYMTKYLLDAKKDEYDNVKVVFANTGQEHEETLKFVDRCDKEFGFNVVWIEAHVISNKKGIGTKHKIVNFKTASRNGEPYEAVIAKYGIPNRTWQICSRELKVVPVRSYLRSIGWKRKYYHSAIGIRFDEVHRVSSNMVRDRVIYPLAEEHPTTKQDVLNFWRDQKFDLYLPEYLGNCTWCWKKSNRKLFTLANESPEIFDFPNRMEEQYGHVGLATERRVFFRKYMSTKELLEKSKEPFDRFVDNNYVPELDDPNGCSESCEPF